MQGSVYSLKGVYTVTIETLFCSRIRITILLGPVVQESVNAHLGLKFDQGSCSSYFKRVFTANSKWSFESKQSQNVEQNGINWNPYPLAIKDGVKNLR